MPLAFPPLGTRTVAASALTIAASTWRWDGVSGAVKVSSGVAMQPGYCTAANLGTYRVFVGGVEQAVAVKALDGTFPDGSYRSILTQFQYTLTHNLPVASEIRLNQGPRGTTDIAFVEPNLAIVSKKAVIAPTDPVHLCNSFVTLGPLTPATNDTGINATWAAFGESSFSGGIRDGTLVANATYDTPGGLWQLYCRTGNRTYYQWAYDWACEQKGSTVIHANAWPAHLATPYMIGPIVGGSGITPQADCSGNGTYNPEGLDGTNSSCGTMQENMSLRISSMAPSYWMTGWRQFKRLVAKHVNYSLAPGGSVYATQRDLWISFPYGHRFNLGAQGMISVLIGYLMGCTSPVPNHSLGPNTDWDYEKILPWMLDALGETIWAMGGGDYRDGLVGQRHTTIAAHGGDEHWGITNFQLTIMSEFLMLWYDNITPDSRISGWMKTICDYQIGQSRAQTTADYTYPNSPYISAYDNFPPAYVANSTYTATTTSGSPTMTWTGGNVPALDYMVNNYVWAATGIPDGAYITARAGNTLTLSTNATATGSRTCSMRFSGWYLAMFGPTFAWYYAYSGDATYDTWAARTMVTTAIAMADIKNWAEVYGGVRQSVLYYRAGGTIRGTPGVHPTAIVNPPLQPVLG
jgi:hypothetical protein